MVYVDSVIDTANKLFKTTLSAENANVGLPVKLSDVTGFEDPNVRNTSVRFTSKMVGAPKLDLVLEYNRLYLPKLVGLKGSSLTFDTMPSSTHDATALLTQWLGRPVNNEDVKDLPIIDEAGKLQLQLVSEPTSYGLTGDVTIDIIPPVKTVTVTETDMMRFAPKYWRIDGPRTMSLSLTTTDTSLEAYFLSRTNQDLCGLIWDSVDKKNHKQLAYATNLDYRNCVWSFDVEVSPNMAEIADPIKGLVLTVYGLDDQGYGYEWYVPIRHYSTAINARKARVTIDWATAKGGFNNDEPINAVAIETIFFSGVSARYDVAGTLTYFDVPEENWIRIDNVSTTGTAATLKRKSVQVTAHDLGMCTSYDDHYDLSPQRLVENIIELGYRGIINHYVGMSTYPERHYSPTLQRFVTPNQNDIPVINEATRRWHADFAAQCKAHGLDLMQSVSYELFSEFCPLEWTQRDYNDNYAATGWSPPSYLMSPCNADAMSWMKRAMVEFSKIADDAGLPVIMQVGEPWWWWNTQTRKPCIYDYQTRLAFNAATGEYAPDFGTIDSTLSGGVYDDFKAFLSRTLGESVLSMRTAVRTAYPNAQVTTLFFLPSILTPEVGIMQEINYPKQQYSYPNLDFMMTEAYDWLITAQVERSEEAMRIPLEDLGYPANKLHYLAGFVPDANMAELLKFDPEGTYRQEIWQRIFGNVRNNLQHPGVVQYLWSYPQVMTDSIVYQRENYHVFFHADTQKWDVVQDDRPYDSSTGEGGHIPTPPGGNPGDGTYLPARPSALQVLRNSWGDLTFSWQLIDEKVKNPQFLLELYPEGSSTPAWSKNTTEFSVKVLNTDIPNELKPIDNVRFRVRRIGGPSSQITNMAVPYDPSEPRATNATATRNTWGDFWIKWEGPDDRHYTVTILNEDLRTARKSYTVNGKEFFYTAAQAATDHAANVDYLRFQVALTDAQGVPVSGPTAPYADTPAVDNSRVKKLVAMGINSLVGGYFNDLSDTIDPGGTGKPGRKDVVAANTFRVKLAQALDLEPWEVLPLMTVVGSSPINPMPYQGGFPLDNYWWDAATNSPGPNLIIADNLVRATGLKPDYFIESGPGETTGIAFAPVADRPGILSAWRTSNIAMLTWMRQNWGNESLEIWFQGATTSWWGDPPPAEVNFEGAKLLRDLQTSMALEGIGFKLGSYVPEGGKYETYLNEMAVGMGWVHYTVAGYHAAAEEMADAMANNINRALDPPEWTKVNPPTDVTALKMANGDIRLHWGSPAAQFTLRFLSPVTSEIVREKRVTSNTYILTAAEQIELFESTAAYLDYRVAEYSVALGDGPFSAFTGSVYDPALTTPTNLKAYKEINLDVRWTWDGAPDAHYYYRNYDVGSSGVISEGPITGNQLIFTKAEQEAYYTYHVFLVKLDLYAYDPVTGAVGEPAYWNDNAEQVPGGTVQDPTNGVAARNGSEDITQSWDANDATSWRVVQINVMTGEPLYTRVVTEPSIVFTEQEQRDAYVYTAGFVQWLVTALRDGLESAEVSFSHNFNA